MNIKTDYNKKIGIEYDICFLPLKLCYNLRGKLIFKRKYYEKF